MAQHNDAEVAAQKVAQILGSSPEKADRAFVHAAQLFRLIRTQQQFDPFDPFIFLISLLYIWFYDKYVVPRRSQESARAEATRILRIDQYTTTTDQDCLVKELQQSPYQIHLSGVGVLNGNDSITRLLRESVRILSYDKAWSTLSIGLAGAFEQIISGQFPSFD